ncbi:MAG: hypothetical protein LBQ76_04385 [Candidatus Fibromonas sp.]|jgi:hypothetical protein|nr:hypothetical protein [Candidatus Fibromonas sp.]
MVSIGDEYVDFIRKYERSKQKKIVKSVEDRWENALETGEEKCRCSQEDEENPWKNHWENFSGEPFPKKCTTVNGCKGDPKDIMVGAHVKNVASNKVWIAPLCKSCNDRKDNRGIFSLKPGTILVSANQEETCDVLDKGPASPSHASN